VYLGPKLPIIEINPGLLLQVERVRLDLTGFGKIQLIWVASKKAVVGMRGKIYSIISRRLG
jgi:hypothetical protein